MEVSPPLAPNHQGPVGPETGGVLACQKEISMSPELMEATITSLVASRYPHEVAEVLASITDPRDLNIAVGAALARSVMKGRAQGVEMERDRIRRSLGL